MNVHCRIVAADASWACLQELLSGEREIFVVYDKNVSWVAEAVSAHLSVKGSIAIGTSEESKTLESVQAIERALLQADATRGALLLAIGGGITTDLAGFAAAIYKRGIRYANIPTTLLSQVDAAIGGKTGVNLDGYKNMLGAFHMPEFTCLCPAVLGTLPAREFRAGLSEMLKTFLLADAEAYAAAVQLFADTKTPLLVSLQPQNERQDTETGVLVSELIAKAAAIKAAIVEEDPTEKGRRAVLNLGHTFGHAIEQQAQVKGDDIMHGEAVAMGMIMAAQLSEAAAVAQQGLARRLEQDFARVGLPTQCPYPAQSLLDAMAKDKKAAGGKVKFVLPVCPGEVVLKEMSVDQAYDLYLHTK